MYAAEKSKMDTTATSSDGEADPGMGWNLKDKSTLKNIISDSVQMSQKSTIGKFYDSRTSTSPYRNKMEAQIRLHARSQLLRHEEQKVPSTEDIECLESILYENADPASLDNVRYIGYRAFKRVVASAPERVSQYLSARVFAALLSKCADSYGHIPIDYILEYVKLKREKTLQCIRLCTYDSVGNGYLTADELRDYIHTEFVSTIPSLCRLQEDGDTTNLEYYLDMATAKFFFMLDPKRLSKIRIMDILASRLLNELDDVALISDGSFRSDGDLNWFSAENFQRLRRTMSSLNNDDKNFLSLDEISNFRALTNVFIRRVFQVRNLNEQNGLDWNGFCELILAIENRSDPSSIKYHFRILDVDSDGFIDSSDLLYFYKGIEEMSKEITSYDLRDIIPIFEDIRDEIFDLCRPKSEQRISMNELLSSGKGDTIVGILTDIDCLSQYENRENNLVSGEECP
ncbi:hypothetical protein AB6A40_004615 [Gnathostoma spinigerum]|uniref:EF-hand domain-containing protein n=1 Tax=Gnathostoma spinigerum TaxID=75299 RepID=A0ABD6EKF9_9BILA